MKGEKSLNEILLQNYVANIEKDGVNFGAKNT
jgi:hypothetical protein